MRADDIEAALGVQRRAVVDLSERMGRQPWDMPVDRGHRRLAHLLATDPGSVWVHEGDGVDGMAQALVRDGMWFLSLLMVDPSVQGTGIGAALLDAALGTSTDRSWITSTDDPAALRRYRRAGFDLLPSYGVSGSVDRALLTPTPGVRVGLYDADRDHVDRVLRAGRGSGVHGDLAFFAAGDAGGLLVHPDGFAVARPGGVAWLAATTEPAGRELLVAAVGLAGETVEVDWLTADQQWAIEVCLDLRLTLRAGASVCLRGQRLVGPYLPHGAFG